MYGPKMESMYFCMTRRSHHVGSSFTCAPGAATTADGATEDDEDLGGNGRQ